MENNNDIKEWLENWMLRLMERFNRLDDFMELLKSQYTIINGERYMDNQDLCQLLNVSKRTLQRYRSSGELPYHNIFHKIYYKEADVETFIKEKFNKNDVSDSPDDTGSDPEGTDSP